MSERYRIEHGDCLDLLKREPANSWDGMVTDPPGGIAFMGRAWDKDKGGRKQWVRFMQLRFKAVLRVLKPGAHAFVWALPRTSHWTGCALEDAGFEIRDCPSHCFGSGFPKSHNLPGGFGTALKPAHELWFLVRKPLEGTIAQNFAKWGTGVLSIDACRVVSGETPSADRRDSSRRSGAVPMAGETAAASGARGKIGRRGDPAVFLAEREAEQDGRWPPNLLLTHDARCRCVGTRSVKANPTWDTPNRNTAPSAFTGGEISTVRHANGRDGEASAEKSYSDSGSSSFAMKPGQRRDDAEGVPVWDCVDGCPVLVMDCQSGERSSGFMAGGTTRANGLGFNGAMPNKTARDTIADSGTASRFFPQFEWNADLDDLEPFIYAAKASRAERDKGLDQFKGNAAQRDTPNPGGIDEGTKNVHPTVKSVELIRHFTRLITPRVDGRRPKVGSIFLGSGTDGVAALLEGCDFVGFELNDTEEEPFVSIARARCEHALGYTYVPRESLRAAEPPKQTNLFGSRETA